LSEKDLIADNYPSLLPDPSKPDKLESTIKQKYFGGNVDVYIVENFVHSKEYSSDFQDLITFDETERNKYVQNTKDQYASILHLMKSLMTKARQNFEYRETERFVEARKMLMEEEGPMKKFHAVGTKIARSVLNLFGAIEDYYNNED